MPPTDKTERRIAIGIAASIVLGVATTIVTAVFEGRMRTAMNAWWLLAPLGLLTACLLSMTTTVGLTVFAFLRQWRIVPRQAVDASIQPPPAASARPRGPRAPGRQKPAATLTHETAGAGKGADFPDGR